jgi:hypothetical protein
MSRIVEQRANVIINIWLLFLFNIFCIFFGRLEYVGRCRAYVACPFFFEGVLIRNPRACRDIIYYCIYCISKITICRWSRFLFKTRETKEGWLLLTVETDVNGESKSTNERGKIFVLPWQL